MKQPYTAGWQFIKTLLSSSLLLLLLLLSAGAQAQSGPFGNEWIVAGQPYYKLKVWRDGMYRLDYNYLQSLNATGVAPTRFQLWRRGKEVAVYQGGTQNTLDATSYLEFYGQRNDGALDREYYKNPADQANRYYSFYTDTAAYFITWGSRAGKRVAQPVAAGGTPHAWRLQTALKLVVGGYVQGPTEFVAHLPWLESSEGFFSGTTGGPFSTRTDSLLRAIVTTPGAPDIRAEVCLVGGSVPGNVGSGLGAHTVNVRAVAPSGAVRQLGVLTFLNYNVVRGTYTLLPGDLNNGAVDINCATVQRGATPGDLWRYSYVKVKAPQQNVWFSDRHSTWFQNDSLLAGPATYEVDNVPPTVVGYDIEDPWNVQRIAPTAAQTLGSTGRRFVFPSATSAATRRLYLADAAVWLTPPTARRVNFRAINPAAPNYVIITHPQLMQPAGTVPNAARAYASYRASVAGGRYDTLMVTAPLLYDQFHYGERSVIALRHFALWLVGSSPATQTKYLLLLGKARAPGTQPGQSYILTGGGIVAANTTRILGEQGQDLVPCSTASTSDNFLSSDWPNNNFVAKMPTGRIPATSPQEVMNYLAKIQQHERYQR
ncbi:MAG: hypothetical protein EOO36_05660 [Cytophagaceae bacterium]|nr:MAG: hypothetical protein EOO36_05660 [Cytophagaceae bacterium]